MDSNPGTKWTRFSLIACGVYVAVVSALSLWLSSWLVSSIRASRPRLTGLEEILVAPIPVSSTFYYLILKHDMPVVSLFLSCGLVAVILSSVVSPDIPPRAVSWIGRRLPRVLIFFFVLMVAATYLACHAWPLSMDEFAPEFQAMIFASGHWIGEWPRALVAGNPYRYHFFHSSVQTGKVISAYWPGFSMLKTPFTLAGISPVLNPVLAIVFVMTMVRTCLSQGSRAQDEPGRDETAGWVILLCFGTAAFWLHAVSFYAYAAVMALNALVMGLVVNGSARALFAAGCAGGVALAMVNPMPHLLFAVPLIVWSLARDRWDSRHLIKGYLCTGLPFVFVWPVLGFMVMKGMPLTVEAWVNAFLDGAWFKDLMGRGWSGSPVTGSNVATLFKHELWTFPGFTLIAASGLWMARDRALARVCLAQITLVFFFYLVRVRFNQGFGWGARYLMTLWPSFIVGCYFLVQHVSRAMPRALSIVFFCSGISLLVLVPARLFQAEDLIRRQIDADPCREMNSGELCIVVPRDGHSADNVRPLPFVSDGKMRVLARTRAEQLFAAKALLKNPFKKKDAWAGSIWASGITPVPR